MTDRPSDETHNQAASRPGLGRPPTLREAVVTILLVAGIIVLSIRLQSGVESVFLPLTLAVGVVGSLGFYLRQPWQDFREGIFAGVSNVSVSALILLLIGALVGVWILAGIIPTLIFYGLKIISPSLFLPTSFLVCLVMSLATGTAYGTIGTVGVALLGVQAGLGLIFLMLAMALKKVPTLLLLFANIVFGALWALVVERVSLATVFAVATTGFKSKTGVQGLDVVLSRGGMTSMEAIVILVLLAGALGGALRATGVLEVLVKGMMRRIRRTGTLVASVLASCYTVILFTGNQALALILVGQMFLPVFKKRRIDNTVLTRSLEDSGTLSAPLVPWGVAGGFCSQMLGVPTVQYFPYMWLAFIVPIFSLILGYTGIAVWRVKDSDPSDVA